MKVRDPLHLHSCTNGKAGSAACSGERRRGRRHWCPATWMDALAARSSRRLLARERRECGREVELKRRDAVDEEVVDVPNRRRQLSQRLHELDRVVDLPRGGAESEAGEASKVALHVVCRGSTSEHT